MKAGDEPQIAVRVDPRIELLSIGSMPIVRSGSSTDALIERVGTVCASHRLSGGASGNGAKSDVFCPGRPRAVTGGVSFNEVPT
jgi:hypothetical protein